VAPQLLGDLASTLPGGRLKDLGRREVRGGEVSSEGGGDLVAAWGRRTDVRLRTFQKERVRRESKKRGGTNREMTVTARHSMTAGCDGSIRGIVLGSEDVA
jgi:hypothetical protein